MKLAAIVVCLSVFVGISSARLTRDELRQALGGDPIFSHQRDNVIPQGQNVNVRLSATDPAVQQPPTPPFQPMMMGSQVAGAGVPVKQIRDVRPLAAGKPIREQEMVLGELKPTKIAKPQPSLPSSRREPQAVNDRMLNNVRPSASVASTERQAAGSKQECDFQIPSFLLPDPNPSNIGSTLKCPSFLLPGPNINPDLVNLMVEHWTGISKPGSTNISKVKSKITQVEFEQKCLIPALRAHVLGGPACKTRELKVYLEWLLYLRQRLFNI